MVVFLHVFFHGFPQAATWLRPKNSSTMFLQELSNLVLADRTTSQLLPVDEPKMVVDSPMGSFL
jgi:hypothetical protein